MASNTTYTVQQRELSMYTTGRLWWRRRRDYKLPWALYRDSDGLPVGFYATAKEAILASPAPARVIHNMRRQPTAAATPR